MKKLLTIIFLGLSTLHAQELTADTAAVEPTLAAQVMQWLWSALALAIGWLVKNALPLLNAYLKQVMHYRGSDVVSDALTEVLAGIGDELQQALAERRLTQEQLAKIKDRAIAIAEPRLKQLSGFYKTDLVAWIGTQIDILLARIGIKKVAEITANP